MSKIIFEHPKGNTLYLAKVGFDWGASWGTLLLGGLPFFLRKMNMIGLYCLLGELIITLNIGFDSPQNDFTEWEDFLVMGITFILSFGISIYLGIKGGELTARHYLEEGYECVTENKALLTRAKNKWKWEKGLK